METIGTLPARMNATDALFWLMEPRPEFRSSIGGLLLLDGTPDPDLLRAEFLRIAAAYPRMRQRVVDAPLNLAPPEWLPDPEFDLDYHLRTIAAPGAATLEDLLGELGPLFATPLDRARPLWEAYFAGGLAGGRSAVFVKVHHCLMDGVGGTRVLMDLLGERPEAPATREPPSVASPSLALAARLGRAAAHAAGDALSDARDSARMLLDAVRHPWAAARAATAGIQGALAFAGELAIPRAASPLHRQRSMSRRLAVFDISLADIDAVRAALGATNNDVLLTIVSGALHRWHTTRGADVKALRALVPVNLRTAAEDVAGNRIALLAVRLPVGEPDALRRLRLVQEQMDRVKGDRRARFYPMLARLVRALPPAVAAPIVGQQMNRANLVCTNVPGPRRTCVLAGRPIEALYAFAPMVGDHPVAVAAYRYRDTVHVGLDVDPLAMDDVGRFLDQLGEACAETFALRRAEAEAGTGRGAPRRVSGTRAAR